ncbi:DUF4837 family protein [Neolewinella aurantiaca]|uniref:DUF4837 family protein n=1 Tax=Neolewinella aurantiaca TaxID=2602767 RepID=A0A5C7FI07_9BACT|nr:DUF4837 family protein [Neolewinella aurantiaca]TXF90131.1 DUF4837 family protein [Neolewinella aurantiaca]
MNFRFLNYLLAGLLGLSIFSCGSEMTSNLSPTPAAFGKINSLYVIADSTLWLDGAQDSVAFFFESPYLILPQPEPIFDVRHIEPYNLREEPTLQQLRNYVVLADLSQKESPTTKMVVEDLSDARIQQVKEEGFGTAVARNKWATGQQLIYLMGRNQAELLAGMSTAYPAVVKRIAERENERIKITTYFQGVNRMLGEKVAERTGATMDIPGGYDMVPVESDDFAWLRKKTKNGSLNIMATRVPYEDQSQLTKEGLITIRDQVGREYLSTTLDSTFMKVNDRDLPFFVSTTELNGHYALEGRGIWEMENDFLGGPFVSYLINDEARRQLVLVDGFVLAPGRKKRELMEELVQVLQTANVK